LIPGLFIVCNHNATVCNIMINKSPGLHDGRPVGPLARALFRPLSNALSGGHFAPRGRISGRFCRPKGTNLSHCRMTLFNMNAVINYKAPRRGLAVSFKQLPGSIVWYPLLLYSILYMYIHIHIRVCPVECLSRWSPHSSIVQYLFILFGILHIHIYICIHICSCR